MTGTSFQQEILTRLSEFSPLYIVGGAVRDEQLGIPSKDIDAVSMLSLQRINQLLSDWGYYPHLIGAKQQTVSLFRGTDRVDIVSFDGEINKDALRRDFTWNALYKDVRTGVIIDPLNGLEDLRNRRLKACGNAVDRFREDPLRILRLVRLAVRNSSIIEPETWQAAVDHLPDIKNVSVERVTEELAKILLLAEVDKALGLLDKLGYIETYISELARLKGLPHYDYPPKDVWNHTCVVVKNTPSNVLLRLAALFHDLGKWERARHFPEHEKESARLVKEILPRFRWSMVLPRGSRGEHELVFLVEHHMMGTLTFTNDLMDVGSDSIHYKARRFAWELGWDGQKYDTHRIENLLGLWRADILGGKQNPGAYWERFDHIQDEIRNFAYILKERINSLDWNYFERYVRDKGLIGEQFGRFKEQVRWRVMIDPHTSLVDLSFLEQEFELYETGLPVK